MARGGHHVAQEVQELGREQRISGEVAKAESSPLRYLDLYETDVRELLE
jgi:hypothetical protein